MFRSIANGFRAPQVGARTAIATSPQSRRDMYGYPNLSAREQGIPLNTRMQAAAAPPHWSPYSSPALSPRPEREESRGSSVGQVDSTDIVQFSSPLYFVDESEGVLVVDVMRLGAMKGRVSCRFRTEDGSAIAGQRYEAGEGEVVFEDGEYSKSFEIQIVESPCWSATLEFKILLEDPVGCELGRYLHMCRVKVIDNDCFPTNKYKSLVEGADEELIHSIGGMSLMLEFFKLIFSVPGVPWRTFLTLLFDQLQNCYYVLNLYIGIYLVDKLFNDENQVLLLPTLEETLALICFLYLAPMVVLHLWDVAKVYMDLQGFIQHFLQTNLFRKYLNYNEESRVEVQPTTMQLSVMCDCGELSTGYITTLSMIQLMCKLVLLVVFTLLESPRALWVVIVMPTLMLGFGCCRMGVLLKAEEVEGVNTEDLIGTVSDCCHNYSVIAHYMQRPQVNDTFAKKAGILKKSVIPKNLIVNTNEYFTRWLGPIFMSLYMAMFAKQVIETGKPSLGTFLATLSIIEQMAGEFGELYAKYMEVSHAIGPLQGLTWLFNKPTDVGEWKTVNRARRQIAKEERASIMRSRGSVNGSNGASASKYVTDLIPLEVRDMGFEYIPRVPLFAGVNLKLAQGKIAAVMGPHGSGKRTLLSLLGHTIFPTSGQIFIPTHLRILHVTQEPIMLKMSAWRNLIFAQPNPADMTAERIRGIITMLDMPRIWELIENDVNKHTEKLSARARSSSEDGSSDSDAASCSDDEDGEKEDETKWFQAVTYTDKVKMSLARALIMNPEVLVLQRPLYHFDARNKEVIMNLMKELVANRGLLLPQSEVVKRRPRTVMFSTDHEREAKFCADIAWVIDPETKNVREVDVARLEAKG